MAGGVALLGGNAVFAQSTLPAIGPTGPPPPATNAVDVAIAPPPPEHRAIVSYQQGQLSVIADNSSLNQILGDISRQTGMKIIGGVADQPVYGTYGPGAPAQILVALLEGTHSNMLLRETADSTPTELVLTPLDGSPTPPNPTAPRADDYDTTQSPQPASAPQTYDMQRPPAPTGTFRSAAPNSIITPPISPVQPDAAPAEGSGDPRPPNGVATPQQIYQQLQQLQRAQPQPPSGSH